MPSKRQRDQWKNARVASLQKFEKRREEYSSIPNFVQPQLDEHKANTSNTSDTESWNRNWFWNETANERDSDAGEEGCSEIEEPTLDEEQPSHEGPARFESRLMGSKMK